jgi:hypothetical protein
LVEEAHPLGLVGYPVLNLGYRDLNLEYPALKGVLVWPAGHLDYLRTGIGLMEPKDRFRSLSPLSAPPLKEIVPKVAEVAQVAEVRVPLLPSFPLPPLPEVRVPQLEVWVSRAEVYLVGVPRAPMVPVCPPQEAADVSAHPDEVVQELAYLLVPLALAHLLDRLALLAPAYVPSALVVGV